MTRNKFFWSRASVWGIAFAVFTIVCFLHTSAFATPTYQSFHAFSDGYLQVWQTTEGVRGNLLKPPSGWVKECFTYKWKDFGKSDREIAFAPKNKKKINQKEAFFDAGNMADWDNFWDTQTLPFYFEWPILADATDLMDIYIGVDLTLWTSSPVSFSFGDVISIANGRNDTLLPGYLIGMSPIDYVPGTGWVTSNPLTSGNVVVVALRDGEPVPEPSTILLLGFGLAGIAGLRRQSRGCDKRSLT